jgi:hypothetical protein
MVPVRPPCRGEPTSPIQASQEKEVCAALDPPETRRTVIPRRKDLNPNQMVPSL